ncbi:MAG: hypothetical protein ABIJ75_03515 [Actinomycetota bacterium]
MNRPRIEWCLAHNDHGFPDEKGAGFCGVGASPGAGPCEMVWLVLVAPGVAIQADPCRCQTFGIEHAGCNYFVAVGDVCNKCGWSGPCSKCHGLGVIPRHGSIERVEGDGPFNIIAAPVGLVLVVPIEGDE